MRQLAQLLAERVPNAPQVIVGVVLGTVANNKDKEGLNRVAVKLPWLTDGEVIWARVATPMAGKDRGLYVLPEVDDEVLVMFERGDVRFPYVVGSLWNGEDKSPENNADGNNNRRVFKSRSGHQLIFNDDPGKETVEIVDASGKNSIVIDTAKNTIAITSDKDIQLTAPKGTVTISAQTIDLKASGDGSFSAGGTMTVHATDDLTVRGRNVNIN
jgi:uncharacterized protein involved in type VI secretion and phage assembly